MGKIIRVSAPLITQPKGIPWEKFERLFNEAVHDQFAYSVDPGIEKYVKLVRSRTGWFTVKIYRKDWRKFVNYELQSMTPEFIYQLAVDAVHTATLIAEITGSLHAIERWIV